MVFSGAVNTVRIRNGVQPSSRSLRRQHGDESFGAGYRWVIGVCQLRPIHPVLLYAGELANAERRRHAVINRDFSDHHPSKGIDTDAI